MPHCEVGHGREAPFKMWYKLHGSGDVKMLFISGLGSPGIAWQPIVDFFTAIPGIQAVTFDNRGVGYSQYPKSTYSTSAMGADALDLVKHLGWDKVHIVGHSMGGMIAQEMALQDLSRVASLTLVSTHAGGTSAIIPMKGAYMCLLSCLAKTYQEKININLENIHSQAWLNAKREGGDGRTNREVLAEQLYLRSLEIPMQAPEGLRGHARAALTHSISYPRLKMLAESKVPVLIITGTDDNMVNPINSYRLAEWLPEAKLVVYKGLGHAVFRECEQEFSRELWNHIRAADLRLQGKSPPHLMEPIFVDTKQHLQDQDDSTLPTIVAVAADNTPLEHDHGSAVAVPVAIGTS